MPGAERGLSDMSARRKEEAAERLIKERGVDLMPPISRNLQLFSCGQVAFFFYLADVCGDG